MESNRIDDWNELKKENINRPIFIYFSLMISPSDIDLKINLSIDVTCGGLIDYWQCIQLQTKTSNKSEKNPNCENVKIKLYLHWEFFLNFHHPC